MDTNQQIIKDLQNKIGFNQTLDLLSQWKGVPVVIKGQILEILEQSIVFRVAPPDSVSLCDEVQVLILHDIFIMGIRGKILNFDPKQGLLELGTFTYTDRGFGDREMVRVEPSEPMDASLTVGEKIIPCKIVDLSLTGFGLVAQSSESGNLAKGSAVTLKLKLSNYEIEIPATLLGVFPKSDQTRLAISFSQDVPGHAIITRYITRRRAEIRQEIQAAYQKAIGENA